MPGHVGSISGGKDSTCVYLLGMEWSDRTGRPFLPAFADVGNEHPWTLDYIRSLPERTGGPEIKWVRADLSDKFETKRKTVREKWPEQGVPQSVCDRALEVLHPTGNPFLDLCLLRAGFPAPIRRFCTDRLKIEPIQREIYEPIWRSGRGVISWQGMRREESVPRSKLTTFAQLSTPVKTVRYLPILDWTLHDVWMTHKRHGIEPNPLYAHGMKRVGCMPCIMVNKKELRVIAARFPEHIDRIAEWERLVGQATKRVHPHATFINALDHSHDKPMTPEENGIIARARWAQTSHGGKQFDMFGHMQEIKADMATSCEAWGVCE